MEAFLSIIIKYDKSGIEKFEYNKGPCINCPSIKAQRSLFSITDLSGLL